MDIAYVPVASVRFNRHCVLASVAVQPADAGVRSIVTGNPAGFAVDPVPVAAIVTLCVAGETYCGRRVPEAVVEPLGIVILNCALARAFEDGAAAEPPGGLTPPPLHPATSSAVEAAATRNSRAVR
jgi:hypothetical protein